MTEYFEGHEVAKFVFNISVTMFILGVSAFLCVIWQDSIRRAWSRAKAKIMPHLIADDPNEERVPCWNSFMMALDEVGLGYIIDCDPQNKEIEINRPLTMHNYFAIMGELKDIIQASGDSARLTPELLTNFEPVEGDYVDDRLYLYTIRRAQLANGWSFVNRGTHRVLPEGIIMGAMPEIHRLNNLDPRSDGRGRASRDTLAADEVMQDAAVKAGKRPPVRLPKRIIRR